MADKLYECIYKDRSPKKYNADERKARNYYRIFLTTVTLLMFGLIIIDYYKVPIIPKIGVLVLLLLFLSLLPLFNRKFNEALSSAADRDAPYVQKEIQKFLEEQMINRSEQIKALLEQCKNKSDLNKTKGIEVHTWFGISIALVALYFSILGKPLSAPNLLVAISYIIVLSFIFINAAKHLFAGMQNEKAKRFERLVDLLFDIYIKASIKEHSNEPKKF